MSARARGLPEERLIALHRASTALAAQTAEIDRVVDEILKYAVSLMCPAAALCRWDADTGVLRVIRTTESDSEMWLATVPSGVGLAGRAYAEGKIQVANDYANWEGAAAPMAEHIGSGLAVPLMRGGTCLGVLLFLEPRKRPRRFTDDDVRLASLFADQAAVALAAAEAFEQQRWAAQHDELTGLHNRRSLQQQLRDAVEEAATLAQPLALMMMDLDRFKEINDTLGHHVGDLLLRQIGPRLRSALDQNATLARLGGDEFAVFLPGTDARGAREIAEHLQRTLEQPFQLDGANVEIGASIGIACYPVHGTDSDTLIRRADVAMYVAKEDRTGWAVYSPNRDHHSPARLALVADLRRAIERDELLLYYQPQANVRDGALYGVEALVRWNHPERGLLAPTAFIPLAEETRLIGPLTQWVIRAALRQLAEWQAIGIDVRVAVNLSAHDIHDVAFPDRLAGLLAESGVAPDRLELEITEGILLADPRRARESLLRLRTLGIGIAIDDFGTGYSSLNYLQRLPVDELKIDRSFVGDMASEEGARAIVRAVIDLADDLGLRVVAEGVEDLATWEVLAALGCDAAQGYYFSPPLPAAELLLAWGEDSAVRGFDATAGARVEAALTERVRGRRARLTAEEEFIARKRAEQALRESEQRLRLAIEAADVATWDWNLVNDRVTWSGGDSSLFGTRTGEGDDTSAAFLARVHPDDRQIVDEAINHAVRTSGELRVEHRIVREGGGVRWVQCKGRVLRDVAGRPVRLLGADADITDRKDTERQRERLLQTEKLRALGQMASGIAHELTQSLLLIAGNGEMASKSLAAIQPDLVFAREALDTVTSAAMQGGETVKRLLMFASSRPDADAEHVALPALLEEVAQLTAARWRDDAQGQGRGIHMLVEADADASAYGWASALREALTNLVLNAVDALPGDGAIRLSAHRRDREVNIEVSDSGVGMPPEVQARIFEPFFTTKGDRGTGLGLAQVFGIVERHRGRVEVESAVGRGTTVRLVLPSDATDDDAKSRLSGDASVEQTTIRPLRILAVDDEPLIGKMMGRILRTEKHVVVTAMSGDEALERLREQSFDVVITDVGLGAGMNGWELAAEVRSRWPGLRVVFATGWGAQIDPFEARIKGVDAVLAKPYRPEELKHVLAQPAPNVSLPDAA